VTLQDREGGTQASVLDRWARGMVWAVFLVYAGAVFLITSLDFHGLARWILLAVVGIVELAAIIGVVQREKRLGDSSPWSWVFIIALLGVFGVLLWFRHDERRSS